MKTLMASMGVLLFGMLFGTIQTNATSEVVVYKTGTSTPVTYRNSTTQVTMAADYNYRVQEMRAIWVPTVTGDITAQNDASASEILAYKNRMLFIFDKMEELGMNVMIYQVRPMNDATYPSAYSPWSSYLIKTKTDPGWDPVEWLIEEAHKRGMEFHAWMNPYRLTGASTTSHGLTKQQFAATMPAYNIASNPDNFYKYYSSSTASGFALNPGLPVVREFINNVVAELVSNYDLDAIHMDDYFYYKFDAASGGSNDNRLDDADYPTFLAHRGSYPNTNAGIADWRRYQTTLLIHGISEVIRTHNIQHGKAVQFGISPTGIYRNGNGTVDSGSNTAGQEHFQSYLYADSKLWVESGWIDYLMPQTYWGFEHTVAGYADVVDWWVKVFDRPGINANLIAAHGIYRALPTAASDWDNKYNEVENEMRFLSKHPIIKGSSFFTFGTFRNTANTVVVNGANTLKEYWAKKVPAAPLQRYPDVVVGAPANFVANNEGPHVRLTWDVEPDARGYLIFKVETGQDVNFNDQNHLLAYVTNGGTHLDSDSQTGAYKYYIKAVSRANHTSSAVQPGNIVYMPTNLELSSRTDTTISLTPQPDSEYSMNGSVYQDSPVFTNLSPNTSYMFYVRRKATSTQLPSDHFHRMFTTDKGSQTAPSSIQVMVYGNQITVSLIQNAEYSIDGINYSDSNVFVDLIPQFSYTVFVRFKQTITHYQSPAAILNVNTLKWPTDAPENVGFMVTHDSIELDENPLFEYSLDGENYQASNRFDGLLVDVDYIVRIRFKETQTHFASDDFLVMAKTRKQSVEAPSELLLEVRNATIEISPIDGAEYSLDGIQWTEETIFSGLFPVTEYIVFARFKETGGTLASPTIQKSITTQKLTVSAPISIEFTAYQDRIVFVKFAGMEYSIDGENYQESTEFSGLEPRTDYPFWIRYKETSIAFASESLYTTITTQKIKATTPSGLTVHANAFGNTITVQALSTHEFSIDGINYQSENKFENLDIKTTYQVRIREKETAEFAPSDPLVLNVRIERFFQSDPIPPTLESTTVSLRILGLPGYEYSFNGETWSRVTFYRDLEPDTTYSLYVRIAQSANYEASEILVMEFTTEKEKTPAGVIVAVSASATAAAGAGAFGLVWFLRRRKL